MHESSCENYFPYYFDCFKIISPKKIIKIYDTQTHSRRTYFPLSQNVTYDHVKLWDVHILNTPPSCIVQFIGLTTILNSSPQMLCLLQRPGSNSSCVSHTSLCSLALYTNLKRFVSFQPLLSSIHSSLLFLESIDISSAHVSIYQVLFCLLFLSPQKNRLQQPNPLLIPNRCKVLVRWVQMHTLSLMHKTQILHSTMRS